MYPLFRLTKSVVKGLCADNFDVSKPCIGHYWVWPIDLDINFHMNNGRYLTLMDIGRFEYLARSGLFIKALKAHWMPLVGSATIRYRKSLPAFGRFQLHTQLIACDEKWIYFLQKFMHHDEVCATAIAKTLFKDQNGIIPTKRLLSYFDADMAQFPKADFIEPYYKLETALIELSK